MFHSACRGNRDLLRDRLDPVRFADVVVVSDVSRVGLWRLFADPDRRFSHRYGMFEVQIGVVGIVLCPNISWRSDTGIRRERIHSDIRILEMQRLAL